MGKISKQFGPHKMCLVYFKKFKIFASLLAITEE